MNKKIDLSQLKGKINANVVIIAVLGLFALVLGYVSWLTFSEGVALEAATSQCVVEYNNSKILLKALKELQSDSDYYLKQKDSYDSVIAEDGTYDSLEYYLDLIDICEEYDLTINEITAGELEYINNVKTAKTSLVVVGDEINVKQMAQYMISLKKTDNKIARIDDITMAEQEDGTVVASLTIVNFTK